MLNKNKSLKISLIATILFYIIVHGYRFSNNMFSYDSLLTLYQNDYGWQIALGRFCIPIFIFLRGSICNPWLISMITICWTFLSVFLTTRILKIEDEYSILLISGIYVANPITIVMNASYIIDTDLYALSCMLAILCVYLFKLALENKKPALYLASILSLAVSMGLYQAYICMAIGLFMLYVFMNLTEKKDGKKFWCEILRIFITMLIAALIYYVGWKICQKVFNIWTSDSYNGLASVGDYSDTSLLDLLLGTYHRVLIYFTEPDCLFKSLIFRNISLSFIWKYLLLVVNMLLIIYTLIKIIIRQIKSKLPVWQIVLQALIIFLFPFGINVVYFISKGMEHTLMIYAFNLIYVFAIWIFSLDKNKGLNKKILFAIPFTVFIWMNFVFANQVYLKKELLDESALSMMTRLVSDVEDMDGYMPGETPVAIYGTFGLNPHIPELADFEEIICYGMAKTNISYIELDYSYLRHIINADMNLVRIDSSDEDSISIINKMPCYPESGSIAFVGDTLVIKVSD